MVSLSREERRARARRIRLVVTDCDGVLTDAGVYYSARGEELKRFSIRDGMGVARLRRAGVETAIITGERSESVVRRGEKLELRHVLLGVSDKLAELVGLGFELSELAFIGDDVNDLAAIEAVGAVGLTGAPADALPEVAGAVHHLCRLPGGHGAFREFAEWILDARDKEGS
jgi:3-deoxy-D-manno-octulosonate 8-phosphate phosphatase (KDO 8-P phosphatase)